MRFGTAMGDESEIRSMLQERSGELLDRLDNLDGACEMGLRITLPPSTSDGNRCVPLIRRSSAECNPLPGTACKQAVAHGDEKRTMAYLERRRSLYQTEDANDQAASRLVEQIVARLYGTHRDWRKLPASSSDLLRLAFLVERGQVAAFQVRPTSPTGCRPAAVRPAGAGRRGRAAPFLRPRASRRSDRR